MKRNIWLIESPKYSVKILFKVNWFENFILKRIAKKRKVEITKRTELKGYSIDWVYVDEVGEDGK